MVMMALFKSASICITLFHVFFVGIFASKPLLNRLPSHVTQIEGSFYIFACSVSSGSMPITFKWLHNGQQMVMPNQDYTIESSERFSFLKLNEIKKSHTGNITCLATNHEGSDSTSTHLVVKGLRLFPQTKCGACVVAFC